jgi:hypothetical protein
MERLSRSYILLKGGVRKRKAETQLCVYFRDVTSQILDVRSKKGHEKERIMEGKKDD